MGFLGLWTGMALSLRYFQGAEWQRFSQRWDGQKNKKQLFIQLLFCRQWVIRHFWNTNLTTYTEKEPPNQPLGLTVRVVPCGHFCRRRKSWRRGGFSALRIQILKHGAAYWAQDVKRKVFFLLAFIAILWLMWTVHPVNLFLIVG